MAPPARLRSRGTLDRMRILTFTSLFPNKPQPTLGVFIYQRVAHLAQRSGIRVEVVAPVPYSPSWLPGGRWRTLNQVPREEQIGSLCVRHPSYLLLPKISMPLHGRLMYSGSLGVVKELHRREPFDCIDAHYVYPDGYAAALLGQHLHIPVIISARGTDINLFPKFRLIRPKIRWALDQAAGIIAVSAALKDSMVSLGTPPEKICVISNGIDAERFRPIDRRAAREKLGLPIEGPCIVAVGNLIPTKGQDLLIAALARLSRPHPNLRLYLVGDGVSKSALLEQARALGLGDRVVLPGARPYDELPFWLNAADFSCLASHREGLPNVVLESLACGTPVLATRVGGIPEVIRSRDLGILVDPDAAHMAAAMERALARTWDRDLLARHVQSRTWQGVAEEVEHFLAECCARRP